MPQETNEDVESIAKDEADWTESYFSARCGEITRFD
jgi:hypothetical protein